MSATDVRERFVSLRNGPVVPVAAYLLLLSFEERGVQVHRDGDGLVVGPRHLVTDDDRALIKRWKRHLLMLVDYCGRHGNDDHLFTDIAPPVAARKTA